MAARSYACSRCGGAVDEQARACGYCGAPVATVRCARCYHMNVPEALHCAGCGAALGLEPLPEEGELLCPDCKEPLAAFRGVSGALHDCPRCGGQLVDNALLRDLLERREVYGAVAPRPEPRRAPIDVRVRYVPCPACGKMMNRKNFAGTSGVIVDVCRSHGVWFDRGELPRVLAFAESGALARARLQETEEQDRIRRAAVAARATVAGPLSSPSRRGDLEEAAADLLSFVSDLLGRW
jgi:Zn-finger nucleic acid-binding protein